MGHRQWNPRPACVGLLLVGVVACAAQARAQDLSHLDGRYTTVMGLSDGRGCTGFGVVPYDGVARDARVATISGNGTQLALGGTAYSLRLDGAQVRGTATMADRESALLLHAVDEENLAGRADVTMRGGACVAIWSVALRRAWSSPAERTRWIAARTQERCETSGIDCRAAAEAAIASGSSADAERFARRACEATDPDAAACNMLAGLSPTLRTAALARACALGAVEACPREMPLLLDSGDHVEAWLRRAGVFALARGRYLVNEITNIETGGQSISFTLVTTHRDPGGGHSVVPGGRPSEASRAWSTALRALTRAFGAPERECAGETCGVDHRAVWLFRGAVLDIASSSAEFQLLVHPATTFVEIPAREVPPLDPPPAPTGGGPHGWYCYCDEDDEGLLTVCASTASACTASFGTGGREACVAIGSGAHPGAVLGYMEDMWRTDEEGFVVHEGACLLDTPDPCPPGVDPEQCARD
ncbi:MAG: hypothetical protein U0234_17905 [Sandaracinus sp.]